MVVNKNKIKAEVNEIRNFNKTLHVEFCDKVKLFPARKLHSEFR